MRNLVRLLVLMMTPAVLCAEPAIEPDSAITGRALYLHGDVSADGDVPSGEKPAFHQMLLDDTGHRGMSAFRTAIEAVGFEIHQAYDADVALTDEFLAPWNVLILGSNQRRFSEEEATAVHRWVSAGGGLVAWSDSAFGGHYAEVGLDNTAGRDSDNDLTKQFGMVFLTDNGGGNYLIKDYEEAHFLNAKNPKGGVRYRGEGVSPVRIAPPARMLAKLQEGGLGGKIMVNKIDAPFDPQTDAALAIAHVGKGRVVGTFDRNTFWNAGEGTRLSHENNLEFAQRLILWAAGREDIDPKPIEQTSTPDVVTVNAGKDRRAKVDEAVALTGKVTGGSQPEVAWRVISGPAGNAEFDNNNAAALETRIRFSQPGVYVLVLEASDGSQTYRDEVSITVE
jgi:hypothetical protein